MSDIIELLAACIAGTVTPEDCDAITLEACAEIARLRLTDAERAAVRFCVTASLPETEKLGGVAGKLCRIHAATLRGLLERLGGGR